MDKYIENEQLVFQFYEEMFEPDDFKEFSFASFSTLNTENYLKSTEIDDIIDLFENRSLTFNKLFMLSKTKHDTFLQTLTTLLPDIFILIQDKGLAIDDILSGEYHQNIKILFKKVSFKIDKYIELIKTKGSTAVYDKVTP